MQIFGFFRLHGCILDACKNDEEHNSWRLAASMMPGGSWLRRSASISRGQLENIQYMPIFGLVRLRGCIWKACKNDEEDNSWRSAVSMMSENSWLRRSASTHRDQLEHIQYMPISVLVRLHGCISKACKNDEEDHSWRSAVFMMSGNSWLRCSASIHWGQFENLQYMPMSGYVWSCQAARFYFEGV